MENARYIPFFRVLEISGSEVNFDGISEWLEHTYTSKH